jgi:hypothetical protein
MDRPICIDPARVAEVWPHAEGLIDEAMRRGGLNDVSSVRDDVLAGKALLWIVWDEAIKAAGITKIVKPYDTRICILVACGGSADWQMVAETIEDYARAQDCAITRIYGREGWQRVLPGYRRTRVILDKEL